MSDGDFAVSEMCRDHRPGGTWGALGSSNCRQPSVPFVATNPCDQICQPVKRTEVGATGKNAEVHAAGLVVNDGISKRVAEWKAVQAQKGELSRDQLREFLTEVILTPAGKVN
jgi:hypothetical protein